MHLFIQADRLFYWLIVCMFSFSAFGSNSFFFNTSKQKKIALQLKRNLVCLSFTSSSAVPNVPNTGKD